MAPVGEVSLDTVARAAADPASGPADRWGSWLAISFLSGLAALMAWPGVMALDGRFPVENLSVEMTNRIRNNRDDPVAWAQERTNRWTSLAKTSASCLAVFGGIFGGLMGGAIGARRWWSPKYALLGLVSGVGAGLGGGVLESTLLIRLEKAGIDPLLLTALGHAVAWGCLATPLVAVMRWAKGRGTGGLGKLFRVWIAAAAAALVYALVAAIAFQMLRSDLPIPEGAGNKFLFLLLGSWALGAAVLRPAKTVPNSESLAVQEPVIPEGVAAM